MILTKFLINLKKDIIHLIRVEIKLLQLLHDYLV